MKSKSVVMLRERTRAKSSFRILAPAALIAGFCLSSAVAFGHGSHGPDPGEQKRNPEYKKALAHREDLQKFSSEMHTITMGLTSEAQFLPKTGYVERDYVQLLIQQHQSAISLAQLAVKYGKDAELRALSQKLSEQHQNDIQKLKEWLREHTNLTSR